MTVSPDQALALLATEPSRDSRWLVYTARSLDDLIDWLAGSEQGVDAQRRTARPSFEQGLARLDGDRQRLMLRARSLRRRLCLVSGRGPALADAAAELAEISVAVRRLGVPTVPQAE